MCLSIHARSSGLFQRNRLYLPSGRKGMACLPSERLALRRTHEHGTSRRLASSLGVRGGYSRQDPRPGSCQCCRVAHADPWSGTAFPARTTSSLAYTAASCFNHRLGMRWPATSRHSSAATVMVLFHLSVRRTAILPVSVSRQPPVLTLGVRHRPPKAWRQGRCLAIRLWAEGAGASPSAF